MRVGLRTVEAATVGLGGRRLRGAAVAVALLAAGCMADDPVTDPAPGPDPGTPPNAAGSVVDDGNLTLQLHGCHGAFSRFREAPGVVGGDRPTGWGTHHVSQTTDQLDYWWLSCAEASVGDVVGPLKLVIETHNAIDPPAACLEGDWRDFGFLQNILVDDARFASELAERFGMPARAGAIHELASTSLASRPWTFANSSATFTKNPPNPNEAEWTYRMFWGESAVSWVTWTQTYEFDQGVTEIVDARFDPEYLAARSRAPTTAPATVYASVVIQTEISRFQDTTCQQGAGNP